MVYEHDDILCHHGVKGQKWGVRRYQNPDGSLTPAGHKRYEHLQYKTSRKVLKKQKTALYRQGDIRLRAEKKIAKLDKKSNLSKKQEIVKQAQKELVDNYYKNLDKTQKMVDEYVSRYGQEKISNIKYKKTKYGEIASGNKKNAYGIIAGRALGAMVGSGITGSAGSIAGSLVGLKNVGKAVGRIPGAQIGAAIGGISGNAITNRSRYKKASKDAYNRILSGLE